MLINGNKLCPHCGFRHTIYRPLGQSAFGWDCPQCGRRLSTSIARGLLAMLVPCVVLYLVLGQCDTLTQRVVAIWAVWLTVGPVMMHLAMDVRAVD